MITDEQIRALPDDPDLAFAEFESIVRDYMDRNRDEHGSAVERTYVAHVLAFIHEHQVGISVDDSVPSRDDDFWPYFSNLLRQLDYHKTRLRLRAHKNMATGIATVVALSGDYRSEIHAQLAQMRKIISAAEMPVARREALFARLNALAAEVDRERTRLESFTSIWLEVTQALGEGAENLEPVMKKIERIAKILSKAKSENETGQLLPPTERKMITGPERSAELGDEIPF